MKIYQVFPKAGGPSHVVIAKSATEAINATVKHLNQFQTGNLYKASDFSLIDISDYMLPDPVVID
nr:hypothetical protein [Limosilactobacillus mucosae]